MMMNGVNENQHEHFGNGDESDTRPLIDHVHNTSILIADRLSGGPSLSSSCSLCSSCNPRYRRYKWYINITILWLWAFLVLLGASNVIFDLVRFRYQTGLFMTQDYDYYSNINGVKRKYGNDFIPVNYTQQCPSSHRPTLPNIDVLKQDILHNSSAPAASISSLSPLIVHVLKVPNRFSPKEQRAEAQQFDWVWYTILGYHPPHVDKDHTNNPTYTEEQSNYHIQDNHFIHIDPNRRIFPQYNIQFQYIDFPIDARNYEQDSTFMNSLTKSHNLFIIADWTEFGDDLRLFLSSPYLVDKTIGLLSLGEEYCFQTSNPYSLSAAIKFIFLIYGDCHLVDNEQTFSFPLGPLPYVGRFDLEWFTIVDPFSTTFQPTIQREYWTNLMVGYTERKPSRMQALLAAHELCANLTTSTTMMSSSDHNDMMPHSCYVPANVPMTYDFLQDHMPVLDTRPSYLNVSLDSLTTLCPLGNHPETYRIYEAIMLGSIPFIETLYDHIPLTAQNVAWGKEFHCLPRDLYESLYATDAPVIWIRDWKTDLPTAFDTLTQRGMDGILDHRQRMGQWWHRYREYLQTLILRQVARYMQRES